MAQLNFSIALNLLTAKFKDGVSSVKSGFASMRMQVATFIAALRVADMSITGFVSKLIDTARETNRATTALKNISPSIQEYVKNQKWAIQLSEKYGTNVNVLTSEFAKFTAAGNLMNMPLADQRKIFESVDRACTAFSLTAEDTNSVFLALTQMMGKGKIQAQELRLQMGEKLPVAINAMAMAAGGSIGSLDNLMKKGQLLSADVLPKFADALNKLIPNVNTDNLETSIKRMDNAFIEMEKNTTVKEKYKSLIDGITSLIKTAAGNIKNIVSTFWSVVIGYALSKGAQFIKSSASQAKALEIQANKSNKLLVDATKERMAAEVEVERSGGSLQSKIRLDAALKAEELAKKETVASLGKLRNAELVEDANKTSSKLADITRKRMAAEEEMRLAETAYINSKTEKETKAATARIENASKDYFKYIKREAAAAEEARISAIDASSAVIPSKWEKTLNTIKTATARFAVAIKSILSYAVPMALFTIISMIGTKIYNSYERAKKAREMLSDAKKDMKSVGSSDETIKLKNELDYIDNIKNNLASRKNVLKELNTQLKTNFTIDSESLKVNGNITKAVKDRVKYLEDAARAQHAIEKELEMDDKRTSTMDQLRKDKAGYDDIVKRTGVTGNANAFYQAMVNDLADLKAISETKIYYHKQAQSYIPNSLPKMDTTPTTPTKKTELQKEEETYNRTYQKLNEELKNHLITQTAYNKAYDKLNVDALAKAKASGDKGVLGSSFYKMLQNRVDNPKTNPIDSLNDVTKEYEDKLDVYKKKFENGNITQEELSEKTKELAKTYSDKALSIKNIGNDANGFLDKLKYDVALSDLSGVQSKYAEDVETNRKMLEDGLMSQEDYNSAVSSLSLEAAKSAISIKNIGDGADEFVKRMQKATIENLNIPTLKDKKTDTTFDYRKQKNESNEEELQRIEEYVQVLKDKAKELGGYVSSEIDKLIKDAESKENVLKLAVLKQDIKDIQKEVSRTNWDGIKDAVSGVENIESAMENLTSTLGSNASAWKKLMSLWDAFSSVIDTINSVSDTIENLTELTTKLGLAKKAEAIVQAGTQTTETAAVTAGATAHVEAKAAEVVANEAAQISAQGLMAAESAAAYAGIPFIGAGLASGQVTAMLAMIKAAQIPAFATGGIIGGNSTSGDNVLARVNSGEMILNKSQQSNLFRAINSGALGGGSAISSTITSKVRGTDILLTINNELKRRGRKTL